MVKIRIQIFSFLSETLAASLLTRFKKAARNTRDYIKLATFKYTFSQQNQCPSHSEALLQATAVNSRDMTGWPMWLRRLVLPHCGRRLPVLPCLPAQSRWRPFHLVICHLSPGRAKLLSKDEDKRQFQIQRASVGFLGSDLCYAQS